MKCFCRFCRKILECKNDSNIFICDFCNYQFYYNSKINKIEEEFFEFDNNICCSLFYYESCKHITICKNDQCYHLDFTNDLIINTKINIEEYVRKKLAIREGLKMLH